MKFLTVIVPTYNMEKYLEKCLSSLIVDDDRLMLLFEVLVINDGSIDSSSAIGHRFEKDYPNTFRVIDKENGNYGSCINAGLKEASGKYLKILDADDTFDTKSLQFLLESIIEIDEDLILTNSILIDSKEQSVYCRQYRDSFIKTSITFEEFVQKKIHNDIEMHDVAYKRELLILSNYKQTEGISYTDNEWMFLPMTMVSTIKFVDIVLYKYLVGREGQTIDTNISAKKIHEKLFLCRELYELYDNFKGADIHKRYLYERTMRYWKGIYKLHGTIHDDSEIRLHCFDRDLKKWCGEWSSEMKNWIWSDNEPFYFIKYFRQGWLYFLSLVLCGEVSDFVNQFKIGYMKYGFVKKTVINALVCKLIIWNTDDKHNSPNI